MFVIHFGTVHKHVVQKGSCSDIWYDHSRENKYCYRPVHASIAITFVLKSLKEEGKALPPQLSFEERLNPSSSSSLPFPHCFASIHSEGQIFRCWMKVKFGLRALISICSTVLHDRLKHKSLEFHMRASAKFFMQGYSHSLWPTRSFCGYRFLH